MTGGTEEMATELSWTSVETWTLIIGVLAIGVTLGIWVHSIWSNRKFRRVDALQKVREKVTTNAEHFRNVTIGVPPFVTDEERVRAARKYYSEVCGAYKASKSFFKEADQRTIDAALEEIAERDGFSASMAYDGGRSEMGRGIALIEKALQRD